MMKKVNKTELHSPPKTSTNEGSTSEQAMDRTTHLTKYVFVPNGKPVSGVVCDITSVTSIISVGLVAIPK